MKNGFFAAIIEYDLTEIDHQNGNKFEVTVTGLEPRTT